MSFIKKTALYMQKGWVLATVAVAAMVLLLAKLCPRGG